MANHMLNLGDYSHTNDDFAALGEAMTHVARGGGYKSLRVRFAIYATAQLSRETLTKLFLRFNAREILERGPAQTAVQDEV